MLKFELDNLDGLEEGVKALYTEHEGKYRLQVDGIDPADELKEALRKEREESRKHKDRLKEFETAAETARREAEEARLEAAKKSGDTEALEKSWQEKLAAREAELNAELEQFRNTVTSMTSGQTATKLAAELAIQGSADVLELHIQRRLKTDYRDGKPVTVVLDANGAPSAATVEDLKKEFTENPAFAPLIVGSKASGAGPHGGNGGGAAKKFQERTGAELAQLRKDNPVEYERLRAEYHGTAN